MQGNLGKWHLILRANEVAQIQIGESLIESTHCEKLFGVKIDSKLSFDKHIKTICKKASNELRVLARVAPYMDIAKDILTWILITVHYFECVIVVGIIQRLLIFLKEDAFD